MVEELGAGPGFGIPVPAGGAVGVDVFPDGDHAPEFGSGNTGP